MDLANQKLGPNTSIHNHPLAPVPPELQESINEIRVGIIMNNKSGLMPEDGKQYLVYRKIDNHEYYWISIYDKENDRWVANENSLWPETMSAARRENDLWMDLEATFYPKDDKEEYPIKNPIKGNEQELPGDVMDWLEKRRKDDENEEHERYMEKQRKKFEDNSGFHAMEITPSDEMVAIGKLRKDFEHLCEYIRHLKNQHDISCDFYQREIQKLQNKIQSLEILKHWPSGTDQGLPLDPIRPYGPIITYSVPLLGANYMNTTGMPPGTTTPQTNGK